MNKVLISLAAVALAACASPETSPPVSDQHSSPSAQGSLPAPTPADVIQRVTAADNGRTIDVAVGARFAVELVGVPTAGYLWGVAKKPAFLSDPVETGGNTSTAQSKPGFTGGNHWEVFVFTATAAGEGKLTLEQRRPWEKTEQPSQTFDITVRAR